MHMTVCKFPNGYRGRRKINLLMQEESAMAWMIWQTSRESDTNAVIAAMKQQYLTMPMVLEAHAEDHRHMGLSNTAAEFLMMLPDVARYMMAEEVLASGRRLTELGACKAYFLGRCHGLREEHLFMISLGKRGKLLAIELIDQGEDNRVRFPVQKIVKTAYMGDAHYIVIAHNHPSGDPAASDADVVTTRKLLEECESLQIVVLDHLIVSGDEVVSMRIDGQMEQEFLAQAPKDKTLAKWPTTGDFTDPRLR